jgi:nicotinamidase-related amidase
MNAEVTDASRVGILLIDVQPAFVDTMHGSKEPLLTRLECLLTLATCLNIPTIATFEEPVERKGRLPEPLEKAFPTQGQRFTKKSFNCCSESRIVDEIRRLEVKQVVVAGAETDVCVLQSVLGLLKMGLTVFVLEDCVFTSEAHSRPALNRMYYAGAIPSTVKTLFYELKGTVDADSTPANRRNAFNDFTARFQVEKLPPWDPAT